MINSTNTVNIDGNILKDEEIIKVFTIDQNDKYSRWVVRPIFTLAAIGIGITMFFASAFLIVLSLAMVPLLAISLWVVKKKVERDLAEPDLDPIVDGEVVSGGAPDADAQVSS